MAAARRFRTAPGATGLARVRVASWLRWSAAVQQPLAIGQLGEAMGISRQAARQMADGLVERGYATFGTDDADARRTLVVLTPRGKAYGRAIWRAQDALNETVRSRVSEADLAVADAVLRAVFPDDNARQRVDKRMPRLSLPFNLPGLAWFPASFS